MKQITIQDLKATLSATIAEAEAGTRILITRHNATVAQLGPPVQGHIRRGSRLGSAGLAPAVRRGTKGRYLAVLLEDRGIR